MQNRKRSIHHIRVLLLLLTLLALLLEWPGLGASGGALPAMLHGGQWTTSLITAALCVGLAAALGWTGWQGRLMLSAGLGLYGLALFVLLCGLVFFAQVVGNPTLVVVLQVLAVGTGLLSLVLLPGKLAKLLDTTQELRRVQQELQDSRIALQQQRLEWSQSQGKLADARGQAEFHAALCDLLYTWQDADTVVERALSHLGAALGAEQISAIRILNGRAQLWHAWGDFQPHALSFLMGEGTPVSELVLLRRVVSTGESYYAGQYQNEAGARPVSSQRITAAFEPIKNRQGQVVAVLAFSREEERPWDVQVREVARRAATTLGLVLELQHQQDRE